MGALWNNVRYGGRALLRQPTYTAVAVLTMALGVGANTAIYSVVYAVLLRMLPVAAPERLVVVTTPVVQQGGVRYAQSFSYPLYRELRDRGQLLEALIAFRTLTVGVSVNGATERAAGAVVSGNYFHVLGVTPALGTVIVPEDDEQPDSGGSRGAVVVVSHDFWVGRLGGRASAIGQVIDLNGHPFTVVGVAPRGFNGAEVGQAPDVFAPMMLQSVLMPGNQHALTARRNIWLRIMGRLRAGADARQAEGELTVLLQRFNQDDVGRMKDLSEARRRGILDQRIALQPGGTGISGLRSQYGPLLITLLAIVGVVLMIACANVANLSLARAAGRERELAVRLALGATRWRLVSLLGTESLLIALGGGILGLLLSRWGRDLLVSSLLPSQHLNVSVDTHVFGFTLLLAILTGILFGLVPALQASRPTLTPALGGQEPIFGGGHFSVRNALVVLQVGLSVFLLIGAGLFVRTLRNLRSLDPGFVRENVLLAAIDPTLNGYTPDQSKAFYQRLVERMRAMPGVRAASFADCDPLTNNTFWNLFVPGYEPQRGETPDSDLTAVGPGYFATLGIPLLRGRDIGEQDGASAPRVAVVNEAFARLYFRGADPIGKRIGTSRGDQSIEIIGLVRDSKYHGLREPTSRMLYIPYMQPHLFGHLILHVRTAGNTGPFIVAIRENVRQIDPEVPVFDVHTVEQQVDRSLAEENLMATLAEFFGTLALCLSAVGVYGVMASAVSRRTREVGIRMALGAEYGTVVRLVLSEAAVLVAGGIAVGVPVACALAKLVANRLYGVATTDPTTVVLAITVLALAALPAAWVPARRAARVDPLVALRYE